MSTTYNQIRVKTENRSNYTSQIYPRSQGNNYNLAYTSPSPSIYYSKINNEKELLIVFPDLYLRRDDHDDQ